MSLTSDIVDANAERELRAMSNEELRALAARNSPECNVDKMNRNKLISTILAAVSGALTASVIGAPLIPTGIASAAVYMALNKDKKSVSGGGANGGHPDDYAYFIPAADSESRAQYGPGPAERNQYDTVDAAITQQPRRKYSPEWDSSSTDASTRPMRTAPIVEQPRPKCATKTNFNLAIIILAIIFVTSVMCFAKDVKTLSFGDNAFISKMPTVDLIMMSGGAILLMKLWKC